MDGVILCCPDLARTIFPLSFHATSTGNNTNGLSSLECPRETRKRQVVTTASNQGGTNHLNATRLGIHIGLCRKCPDNDLQLLLISVVDMCYGLEALAELYWQLIALNDLVENAENANFHLPESFVKRWQICFRRYRCAPTEPDCCTPPLCANTLFAGCGREIEAVNIDS